MNGEPNRPGAISRRDSLAFFAGLMLAARGAAASGDTGRFGPAMPFSWDWLVGQAKMLAAHSHVARPAAGESTADYDAAGRRAFGPADRLAGVARLLPTSRYSPMAVNLHVVDGGTARLLRSTRGMFVGNAPAAAAGFRVMGGENGGDWISFAGASYFRAAGSLGQYGLSARGIAVDTGLDRPEEFPAFTDFWIEALGPRHVVVHALLDGPSLTGAFAFDCMLGVDGVTQSVRSALFLRRDVDRLGIAPATSMFWYDQDERRRATDWRPEVHDSDGLAIWTGSGERIWRPLGNPLSPRVNSFRADGVRGFGLIQRDQRFADYQDDGAFYNRRPSLWAEPVGDWGKGSILLYELPTDNETSDNIVAFWVDDRPARAGERRDFAYKLRWTSADPSDDGAAKVVDIWTGAPGIPGQPAIANARKYVIDFEGGMLAKLDLNSGVEPVANVAKPALLSLAAYPIVGQPGVWRTVLDIRTDATAPKELRLFLRRGSIALSETLIAPLST